MKNHKITAIPDDEFSIEFGDVNGIKLYEIPFMSQKDHRREAISKKKKTDQ